MAIAGRVAIVPKGDYSAGNVYNRLDMIRYNNDVYVAKEQTSAIPTDENSWMMAIHNDNAAQRLSTPRLINGVSFDGTKDVAIPTNSEVLFNGKQKLRVSNVITLAESNNGVSMYELVFGVQNINSSASFGYGACSVFVGNERADRAIAGFTSVGQMSTGFDVFVIPMNIAAYYISAKPDTVRIYMNQSGSTGFYISNTGDYDFLPDEIGVYLQKVVGYY